MNTQRFAAAVFAAFSFAGSAMAMEPTVDNTPFVVTKSRAEVRAEVLAARQAGVVDFGGEVTAAPAQAAPAVALSRAEVRAEAVRAARAHRAGQDNGYSAD